MAAGLTPSLVLAALGVALSNDAAVATTAGLPVIAVLAVKPLARPPLVGTKHTWTCRLTCPSTLDAGSPQAGGLRSRHGSFSQRYGSVSRQGREESRKRGGRAPKRADEDGQGTAGGCPPGSEARGTSRPGQARMGPDHQPVNRQGPRGRRQPGTRTGRPLGPPGICQSRPRTCRRRRRPKASCEDHDLRRRPLARVPVGHRRSPGGACVRTTTGRCHGG